MEIVADSIRSVSLLALRRMGLGLHYRFKRQNYCVDLAIFNRQPTYTRRQFESSRSRAAGIEVKHAVLHFLLGYVAVAIDDCREFRHFRLQVEFRKIM